jgi:hypothetical protein
MTVETVKDCHWFYCDHGRLNEWCLIYKIDFNAEKRKLISFRQIKKLVQFDYHIEVSAFGRVE